MTDGGESFEDADELLDDEDADADADVEERVSVERDTLDGDEPDSPSTAYRKQMDKLPDRPSLASGKHLGARIGERLGAGLGQFVLNIWLLVSKLMPMSARMFRGLLGAGYKGLYKTTGADAIGHIMISGEVRHVPLTYDHEEEKYKTYGDDPEWWQSPAEAQSEYRVGSVPVVWASSRRNELGDHVQAEVAEALDLGSDKRLYRDAEVQHVKVDAASVNGSVGDAVADGAGQQWVSEVSVHKPGELADKVVPLGSEDAARVVSMDKYGETYPETANSEKMHRERQIGRLMEKDRDLSKYAMKMLLIAGAIVVGSLAVIFIGPELIGGGGGGGGGGSIIPIMLGWGL